uniref:Glucanase n=1 Tax=Peronospora matthiolae TaxID=2874970 RepID=A0AAV1TPW5_9STRA
MRRSFRAASILSCIVLFADSKPVQGAADPLCSLPPVSYAKAKTAYPASAFAIEALEKYSIATWYSDRFVNGDYAQLAADLVTACPPDSRISVVVYGLPNKDCAAQESTGGGTVFSASDYAAFITTLASAIGDRKVLYVLEPDAIGLLADTTKCGQGAGYLANLQTAIKLLSQKNANAEIYLDVGYWALEYPATSTAVADIVKQLVSATSRVKGIMLNTSNYQSTSTLATLCSKFQQAIGSTDLHCIFDTSRSYHGGPASNEWCNVKSAGIGALPTKETGLSNVDYFIWAKPPGDSDGTCDGRTSDSMHGPGAGVFFNDLFQSLWNQGVMVAEKGYPMIDGKVHSFATMPQDTESEQSQNQTQQDEDQGQKLWTKYNAALPLLKSTSLQKRGSTSIAMASTIDGETVVKSTESLLKTDEVPSHASPASVRKHAARLADSHQISNASSSSSTMGSSVVVICAIAAAAVVVLAAVVYVRRHQSRTLSESKTQELSALAPLPTTIVDFRPQPALRAQDSCLL